MVWAVWVVVSEVCVSRAAHQRTLLWSSFNASRVLCSTVARFLCSCELLQSDVSSDQAMEDCNPEDHADLDVEPELLWSEQQQRDTQRARRLVHGSTALAMLLGSLLLARPRLAQLIASARQVSVRELLGSVLMCG